MFSLYRPALKKIPSNLKITQSGDIHIMPVETIPEAEDLTSADIPEFDQPTKLALLGRIPSRHENKLFPKVSHSPGASSPDRWGLMSTHAVHPKLIKETFMGPVAACCYCCR